MQFVFVVGCQRSGTTMVGQILGAHPDALLVDENEGLYDALELWRTGNVPLLEALERCFPEAAKKYVDADRRANSQSGRDSSVSHIILKAPNATMFLDDFIRRKDEACLHFVFPVRDGRDVVASMARLAHMRMTERQTEKLQAFSEALGLSPDLMARLASEDTPEMEKKALIWVLKTGLVNAYAKPPLNALWFRYEDLVSDHEYWQRALFAHVGLDCERAPAGHADVYRGVGPGWTFRNRPVDSQSIARWKNRLTAEEARQVWDIAAPTMATLGYGAETPDASTECRTCDPEKLTAPIIATGRGGSGTRLLSVMLMELGVFLGNRLNVSEDSIEWGDLLYEIALGRLQGRANPAWTQELRDRAAAVLGRSNATPDLWGWKLPETMFLLEDCFQAFPQARLIQVVRHPVDSSLRRAHVSSNRQHVIGTNALAKSYSCLGWDRKNIPDDSQYRLNMASWLYQVDQASSFGRSLPADQYLELRYEDICQNPQGISDQLADYLGVPRTRTALAAQLDDGRRWKWSWPDPRADEVWRTCGEVAERFGYAPPDHLAAPRGLKPRLIDAAAREAGPVLFVVGAALGHVGRSLMVAEEVSRRGHKVHIVGCDPFGFIETIIGPRFPCECWPDLREDPEEFARRLEQAVEFLRPSCIVLDTNPLPLLTAWKRSTIPTVFLTNVFLTGLGRQSTVQDAQFDTNKAAWTAIRKGRGLPELDSGRTLYEATRVLLCDPPALWDGESALPPNYQWIGPCSWQPEGMDLPDSLENAKDLFFISLGSTGLHDVPAAAVEAVRTKLAPSATIALHARAEIDLPGVESHERLPAGDVLKRTMVCLTHGGTGSTYQALQRGVPVIVWPRHLNQRRLGELLQRRGLGILLGGESWQQDLDKFADQWDSLRARVRAQSENPWMRDGPARAATVIESVMGTSDKPKLSKAPSPADPSSRVKQLKAKLAERDAALKKAKVRELAVREKLDQAVSHATQLKAKLDERHSALKEWKADELVLREKLLEAERSKRQALQQVQALRESYSWRITGPLRNLLASIKKLQFSGSETG